MTSVLLAHGPVVGALALGLGAVVVSSLLLAVAVWGLSRQPTLSSPNGCVPLLLIGLAALALTVGTSVLWFFTGWTIAGPNAEKHLGLELLLALLVAPAVGMGAVYVTWRRR